EGRRWGWVWRPWSVTNTSPCWYGLIVPASTLRYGSIFCSATRYPRASSSAPMDAAASPLPSEDTTPPVTKMYFGATSTLPFLIGQPRTNIVDFRCPVDDARIQTRVTQ